MYASYFAMSYSTHNAVFITDTVTAKVMDAQLDFNSDPAVFSRCKVLVPIQRVQHLLPPFPEPLRAVLPAYFVAGSVTHRRHRTTLD